jgi:hypothetical protein
MRYLQVDPIWIQLSGLSPNNLYEYLSANPQNNIDPTGEIEPVITGAIVTGAAILITGLLTIWLGGPPPPPYPGGFPPCNGSFEGSVHDHETSQQCTTWTGEVGTQGVVEHYTCTDTSWLPGGHEWLITSVTILTPCKPLDHLQ